MSNVMTLTQNDIKIQNKEEKLELLLILLRNLRKRSKRQLNDINRCYKQCTKTISDTRQPTNQISTPSSPQKINKTTSTEKCVKKKHIKKNKDQRAYKLATRVYNITKIKLSKPRSTKPQTKIIKQKKQGKIIELNDSSHDKLCEVQNRVQLAIDNHKTFTICNHNQTTNSVSSPTYLRHSLWRRNWIEKIVPSSIAAEFQPTNDLKTLNVNRLSIPKLLGFIENDKRNEALYYRVLESKLLGDNVCDLFWNPKPFTFSTIENKTKPILVNCFRKRGKYDFCTKCGLLMYLRELKSDTITIPRSYLISDNEMDQFIADYRITACISLLKWFIQRASVIPHSQLISNKGDVSIDIFIFALLQCMGYVKKCRNSHYKSFYSQQTWSKFLTGFHLCVDSCAHFHSHRAENVDDFIFQAQKLLECIEVHRKHNEPDGLSNLWILKPDTKCRGEGIHLCRSVEEVKDILNKMSNIRFLIQKYIECPILIYKTKFDIRQWFLISSSDPLTAWIYQDCYLRFSSEPYNLKRLHESIHLTNNSVQSRYRTKNLTNTNLSSECMWDLNTFLKYLEEVGEKDTWQNRIYPGMKHILIELLKMIQTDIERRSNTFELFGADFLIVPNYEPCLLEINAEPAMNPSTSVTSRMCPEVIENILQIVLDKKPMESNCIGKFELLYTEELFADVNS